MGSELFVGAGRGETKLEQVAHSERGSVLTARKGLLWDEREREHGTLEVGLAR